MVLAGRRRPAFASARGARVAVEDGRPARGSVATGGLSRVSWVTGAVLAVLAVNVALIVAGLVAVPQGRRPALWAGLAAIIVQCAVAVAAVAGPMALGKRPRPAVTCLLPGALFAAGYVSLLGLEMAGVTVSFDRGAVTVYTWFAGAAGLAGALTGWLTRRPTAGAAGGCWALVIGTAAWSAGFLPLAYALRGTAGWYRFWVGDGAVADYHRSGVASFTGFLLQDMYGAMAAHQILSIAIGLAAGLAGGVVAYGVRTLTRSPAQPAP
jgi:hypothetical protein